MRLLYHVTVYVKGIKIVYSEFEFEYRLCAMNMYHD